MDELVDILDENGTYTGETALKSEAHKKGLFHQTVHIWCCSKNGMVLLQQRGKDKKTHPLKWDVSVAGHIGAGETPELGAFREVEEEIGITINLKKLYKLTTILLEKKYSEFFWDREFTHTFIYELNENEPLKKQESEVEALQWMPLKVFENLVAEEDKRFVPNSTERYQEIIAALKSRL